ncbi:DNA repair protein RecO [Aureimonas sp. OT7]|uniref:DNA repair protein RecO n=1 Tax=Aureimonas TaxID=414371 RepID=UPI001781F360|nr:MULTISPECIES: DNA repair protein RecO [Aureimonas]QOG05960.1 DNA repair protein RecO [Aureimonas sp. OT7]
MEWREEAIILGVRRHGETSVVAEVMTRTRGRHLGLVRGGRSRRQQPVLQPGNRVEANWRARLDEHLGTLTVEPIEMRAAAFMESALALQGVQLLAAHIRLLAERDPHERLYEACLTMLPNLQDCRLAGGMMLGFELALLDELGLGLDLSACALTGAVEGLAYVSPRTGRAVTQAAGAPWADRLLPLPRCLFTGEAPGWSDLVDGFALTGHFLARNIWMPRGQGEPQSRGAFIAALERALRAAVAE